MARDLNRLFEDLRSSREVYVTQDGTVERAEEATENADHEERRSGAPKARTRLKPEIFGGGDLTVSVAESVLAHAHVLAHEYPVETGAIGVGPDERTVTELVPSGPDAKRTTGSFELDADYLQPLLEKAEARGLRFVAFWHSHPEGFSRPSGTDRAAARRMLNDPDWGLPGHVYLPISVRTASGFATRFFVARGSDAAIKQVPTVILSSPPAQTSRPHFDALARAGKSGARASFDCARFTRDQDTLSDAGWSVTTRTTGSSLALRAECSGVVLWFVLPPEYPLSPPDVFVDELGGLRQVPVGDTPELVPWSSLRSLVTVAEQAKKSVEDLRAVESRIVRPWTFPLVARVRAIKNLFPALHAGFRP